MFISSAFALEPTQLGESRQGSPEYLVPVSPNGRQHEAAIEKLLGSRWGNGAMIYLGTSGENFAVSVWGKDYAPKNSGEHALNNFITFIEVAFEGQEDSIRAVATKELQVPIDSDFAIAVQRAWAAMILKTRYPKNRYLGGGGFQTEFSVWVKGVGGAFGQLWSPRSGLTKELMDLGFALADYCKTPESERPNKRDKLVKWLADFEGRVQQS
jgi:hypothetical protein